MDITISTAPCCWGVHDTHDASQPPWPRVLREAAEAGYRGIELGPHGYLPLDVVLMCEAIAFHRLPIVTGTICSDFVSPANRDKLLHKADEICSFISRLPQPERLPTQRFGTPYLTIIDHGHDRRDGAVGSSEYAPRLSDPAWTGMLDNIHAVADLARDRYGIRVLVHPHVDGYIAFEEEIARLDADISPETAGLCLDIGQLYFAGVDLAKAFIMYSNRIDCLHFTDIEPTVFRMAKSKRLGFSAACVEGLMCPIGQGAVDYVAIRALMERVHYSGQIIVEQERNPQDADFTLPDLRASMDYLTSHGFAPQASPR
jgi:inosose dehydratase